VSHTNPTIQPSIIAEMILTVCSTATVSPYRIISLSTFASTPLFTRKSTTFSNFLFSSRTYAIFLLHQVVLLDEKLTRNFYWLHMLLQSVQMQIKYAHTSLKASSYHIPPYY